MAMMARSTVFSVIMPSLYIDCSGSLLDVPHALLRAVSRLFSTLFEFRNILEVEHRDESRCGTHECVRYVGIRVYCSSHIYAMEKTLPPCHPTRICTRR